MQKAVFIICASLTVGLISCDNSGATRQRGAIVFGDSSQIVTEHDPRYLNDDISDFVPKSEESRQNVPSDTPRKPGETPQQPAAAVAEPVQNQPVEQASAVAKGINISVPGLHGGGRKVDWNKERHAALMIAPESLSGKSLLVQGITDAEVKQREQTVVMIRLRNGEMARLPLSGSYSSWETIKGRNGSFSIVGVKPGQLQYGAKLNPNQVRSAVQKLARSRRLSRKETDELLRSVRNVRSANQRPLETALQSVIWRIEGKESGGKSVNKEFRIDFTL